MPCELDDQCSSGREWGRGEISQLALTINKTATGTVKWKVRAAMTGAGGGGGMKPRLGACT